MLVYVSTILQEIETSIVFKSLLPIDISKNYSNIKQQWLDQELDSLCKLSNLSLQAFSRHVGVQSIFPLVNCLHENACEGDICLTIMG